MTWQRDGKQMELRGVAGITSAFPAAFTSVVGNVDAAVATTCIRHTATRKHVTTAFSPTPDGRIDMDAIRWEIVNTMIQMAQVGAWLKAHQEAIGDEAALIIGTSMMLTCRYAAITMKILNNPTIEQPAMGRRCMFY